MRLNNLDLYNFLVDENILALYHANTVGTSCTYFQAGGLLSRGAVANLSLYQTPQTSDAADQVLGVWNDIFLDTTDLHSHFHRENHYGPVLFELDRELVLNENLEIWVTKNNPIYWNAWAPIAERYFADVAELRQKWGVIDRQRMMITIRNNTSPILFNYVRKIIVDDPKRIITVAGQNVILFNAAASKINNVVTTAHLLYGKLSTRTCGSCWCGSNYLHQRSDADLFRFFL